MFSEERHTLIGEIVGKDSQCIYFLSVVYITLSSIELIKFSVCLCVCIYIYIYIIRNTCGRRIIIIIMSRYQHGYFWLSLATPPYRPLVLAGLQGYLHRAAVCMFELDVLPLLVPLKGSTGVHHFWARPKFSNSVPQCPACLVRLILILFVTSSRWPYSCYFVGWCLQDLFNIARSILVYSHVIAVNFFSIRFVGIHMVHPYSSINTTAAWKKLRFIFQRRRINNLKTNSLVGLIILKYFSLTWLRKNYIYICVCVYVRIWVQLDEVMWLIIPST